MRMMKSAARDQWAIRSTTSKRTRRRSLAGSLIASAVGAAHPGVDVVAVLLPEPGGDAIDHVYGREPLERLVAVHRCYEEAHRSAVLARHRAAQHAVRHDDVGSARLVEGEALEVGPVVRLEGERPGGGLHTGGAEDPRQADAGPVDVGDPPAGDTLEVPDQARVGHRLQV